MIRRWWCHNDAPFNRIGTNCRGFEVRNIRVGLQWKVVKVCLTQGWVLHPPNPTAQLWRWLEPEGCFAAIDQFHFGQPIVLSGVEEKKTALVFPFNFIYLLFKTSCLRGTQQSHTQKYKHTHTETETRGSYPPVSDLIAIFAASLFFVIIL